MSNLIEKITDLTMQRFELTRDIERIERHATELRSFRACILRELEAALLEAKEPVIPRIAAEVKKTGGL